VDRYCIKEEFSIETGVAVQGEGPKQELKIWTFYYNDGTIEQVSQTELAK
jgi:nitrite reductase/ring-hydroxylating ferredoxin subunit